jgi:hypothetical protein
MIWVCLRGFLIIASIRKECLGHVIVFGEAHLKRILGSYISYHQRVRRHRAPDRNSPFPCEVESPARGLVVAIPQVGGLHHRYTRAA